MLCVLIYAMYIHRSINSVWVAAVNGLPHWIVSPEMSLVLELTVKQQALLYITVEEQSYAQSFPSPDLKSSVCACFVWLCSSVHVCVCFVRVPPFHHVSEYEARVLAGGVSGGLRYSACCQRRHISPSAPLHRYANPSSSECRAPDQLQFIPFCSLPLNVLTLPPLPLCSPTPTVPFLLSPLCLWFCCLVVAALFVAYAHSGES